MAQTSYHKWDKAHPEKAREYRGRYNEAHPDRVRTSKKKYRLSHPNETRRDKKKWNEAHPNYMLQYHRKWRQEHREYYNEQMRIASHKRRAVMNGAGGSFSVKELNERFEEQEGFCYYCGELLYASFDMDIHIEHKTPISRGGTNDISNIVLSCASCNRKKHTKTAEEFLREIIV